MKPLFVLLICLPLLASAQKRDTIPKYNRSPGDELRIASKRGGLGIVMFFGGSMAIALPSGSSTNATSMRAIGGVIGILGVVLMLNSWSHIGKAGRLMNEHKLGVTFNNGIGIRYRI